MKPSADMMPNSFVAGLNLIISSLLSSVFTDNGFPRAAQKRIGQVLIFSRPHGGHSEIIHVALVVIHKVGVIFEPTGVPHGIALRYGNTAVR
jgi:hypothetical protein